jgi:hypothetical protein
MRVLSFDLSYNYGQARGALDLLALIFQRFRQYPSNRFVSFHAYSRVPIPLYICYIKPTNAMETGNKARGIRMDRYVMFD